MLRFEDLLSSEPPQLREGDYVEDGLLFCGECGTPRQHRYVLHGNTRIVSCKCTCELDRIREEEEQAAHVERVEALYSVSGMDARMRGWTFEKDDSPESQASITAREYVKRLEDVYASGAGLLFYGNVGSGKTFLAACITNELIRHEVSVKFTSIGRIVREMQKSWTARQTYLKELHGYKLLVLDDFAAERDTEYVGEIVHEVIDERSRAGLPLVITTNLTRRELYEPESLRSQRVMSRILEQCFVVPVVVPDRRVRKGDANKLQIRDRQCF